MELDGTDLRCVTAPYKLIIGVIRFTVKGSDLHSWGPYRNNRMLNLVYRIEIKRIVKKYNYLKAK